MTRPQAGLKYARVVRKLTAAMWIGRAWSQFILYLRVFRFYSIIFLIEFFHYVSFLILLSHEQLHLIRGMLITKQCIWLILYWVVAFSWSHLLRWRGVSPCLHIKLHVSLSLIRKTFSQMTMQYLESRNVLEKMKMSNQCNQLDSLTAPNVVFFTNELAFRGEFLQEYELWLLNSTSKHKLRKVICVNKWRLWRWNPVLNMFHKDIFVYVFKMCAWDCSDCYVLNHQAFFFSYLDLLWKDKEKTFYFLAAKEYSHVKVASSFIEVSEKWTVSYISGEKLVWISSVQRVDYKYVRKLRTQRTVSATLNR